MDPVRRTPLYFGLWLIGTVVFSIPAFFLYDPVLDDADYVLGGGADTRIGGGALLLEQAMLPAYRWTARGLFSPPRATESAPGLLWAGSGSHQGHSG